MSTREESSYIESAVTVNDNDISGEYMRVPGDLAYFVKKYAEAEYAYLAAKAEVDRQKGGAYERARKDLEEDPDVKKATEKMVEARAANDALLVGALEDLAFASSQRKLFDGYVDAVKTKRDMLISLGAHMRKERDAEPMIRDR